MSIATIKLPTDDVNYIAAVLATRPYNEVAGLIPVLEDAVLRAVEPAEGSTEGYED